MKKIFLSTLILGTVFSAAIPMAAKANKAIEIQTQTPVKLEELPEAVKKTLAEKFEGWKPVLAFWVSGEKEHYKIDLTKAEEKQVAKIKSDGSIVTDSTSVEFAGIQKETPVKVEELPDEVKKTIAEKLEGWVATAASFVSGEMEYYKVELTKEQETKVVKIGKDGKIIE
jgi:hypothetical protein